MHSLLLFDETRQAISADALLRVFQSTGGFQKVRQNKLSGCPIEADYIDGDDFTTVVLSHNRATIYIDGTSEAALSAAWILKRGLGTSLRMIDTMYSFDLILSQFETIEDLAAAINRARND